jgi:hypothetical protein
VWLLGSAGIVLSELVWGSRSRHRILIGAGAAVVLAVLLFTFNRGVDSLLAVPGAPEQTSTPTEMPKGPRSAAPLQSTAGKLLLDCAVPRGDKKTFEESKRNFRKYAQSYGDTLGVSMVLSDVPEGVKLDNGDSDNGDSALNSSRCDFN